MPRLHLSGGLRSHEVVGSPMNRVQAAALGGRVTVPAFRSCRPRATTVGGGQASSPSSGSPSNGASHPASAPQADREDQRDPTDPGGAALGARCPLSTATHPAEHREHADPRRGPPPGRTVGHRRVRRPRRATITSRNRRATELSLAAEHDRAADGVSTAPTARNGVAAPVCRRRSSRPPRRGTRCRGTARPRRCSSVLFTSDGAPPGPSGDGAARSSQLSPEPDLKPGPAREHDQCAGEEDRPSLGPAEEVEDRVAQQR